MSQQFKNDARAVLATSITAVDTSIAVAATLGDLFPPANMGTGVTGDWFKATLENALGQKEIIKVRTRALGSDVFADVQRAQEGTTARAFDAGTVVGLRLTAGDIADSFAALLNTLQPSLGVVACINSGPGPSADKTRIHKSPFGEYWVWMGDVWRVLCGHYGSFPRSSIAAAADTEHQVFTFTCHRNGLISINAHANLGTAFANQYLYVTVKINGVASAVHTAYAHASGIILAGSTSHMIPMVTNDVVTVTVKSSVAATINHGVGLSYVD